MDSASRIIDLHIHSTSSDGSCSPTEIVKMAKELGLAAIALTDHDTVAGIPEFLHQAEMAENMALVPGVEISVDLFGSEAHIVGLFIDHENQDLLKLLREIRDNRDQRNIQIIAKLNDKGYDITLDEVLEVAGGESVGRPHFAKILIEKGYFTENQEVFDKCLKKGAPGYCARKLPRLDDAINHIHGAGGIAIWAHAVYRRDDEHSYVRKTIKKLIKFGLDGVETYYTTFQPHQQDMMASLAAEFKMIPSGGSDFHGSNQPKIQLAHGYGDMRIPEEVYHNLKRRHEEMACQTSS